MRQTFEGETVAEQASYGFPARMKDIYSAVVLDGASSTKLTYVNARDFDTTIPKPDTLGYNLPSYYVDYGINFELYQIPDAIYDLVLRASQYPEDLSEDTDVSDLLRKDNLIVSMATVFCLWTLREVEDAAYWGTQIVPQLYQASLAGDHSAEDWVPVARGFGGPSVPPLSGEWWKSPFVGRRVW